jgi:hypothetical protein
LAQRLSGLESGLQGAIFAVFRRFLIYKNCLDGFKINLAGLIRPDQPLLIGKNSLQS